MDTHPLAEFRAKQTPALTKAELARKLGVSRATVTRWENGDRKPDDRLWATIQEVTGVKPSALRPDLFEAVS